MIHEWEPLNIVQRLFMTIRTCSTMLCVALIITYLYTNVLCKNNSDNSITTVNKVKCWLFNGNGYMVIPHPLTNGSLNTITFKIMTPSVNGTEIGKRFIFDNLQLKDVIPEAIPDYFRAYIDVNGKLTLEQDVGSGQLRVQSRNTLNNDVFHLVQINRAGKRLGLKIDDEEWAIWNWSALLSFNNADGPSTWGMSYSDRINNSTDRESTEYSPGFIGSITDLVIDRVQKDVGDALQMENVRPCV